MVGEGRAEVRLRAIGVAVLAGLLMVSGAGAALAAQETDAADLPELDVVKARVLERIGDRVVRFEQIIEDLEGEEGLAAEQRSALASEGIAIFEAAAVDVEEASTVRAVVEAVRDATREYRAHHRVRLLYVHVQGDIDKFTRRLDRLDGAIERAEEAGADVSAATAESLEAAANLANAQDLLDVIDPSQTGEEVVEALKEAHRTVHSGQRHIRAGWKALFEVLPPG